MGKFKSGDILFAIKNSSIFTIGDMIKIITKKEYGKFNTMVQNYDDSSLYAYIELFSKNVNNYRKEDFGKKGWIDLKEIIEEFFIKIDENELQMIKVLYE